MEVFDNYALYYDLLNKSKNYKEESDYIIQNIKNHMPNCKKILEFGTGTGKHATYLIDNKFYYKGIELSEKMIEYCPNELRPLIHEGDIRKFKIDEKFDTVISLYHVISYLNKDSDLIQCFENANQHLNKDGLFLFDAWYLPSVYYQGVENRIRRFENNKYKIIRIAESEISESNNLCNVKFSIYVLEKEKLIYQEIEENHSMRFFSINEINELAKKTGFELVEAKPFLQEGKLSKNSWGAFFILKKI